MGFVLGIVLGSLNFFLLTKFIQGILKGETKQTVLLLLAKILTIASSLLITAFFIPNQLIWNGIGLALPLVLGAFIFEPVKQWVLKKMKGKH